MILKDYLTKMKIGLPKTMVHLDKDVYEAGSVINGTIEIKGGLIKNKIKRYDIDLISTDTNAVEETLNSHSVFCSLECCPNQTGKISFLLNVPENIQQISNDYFNYSLSINIDFGNANNITQYVPILIETNG
jgi:sporulation-control protein spo0M